MPEPFSPIDLRDAEGAILTLIIPAAKVGGRPIA